MQIEIIQEFTGRYMKITVEKKAGDFGENVLRYNTIEGILGAEIQQIDHTTQYLFAIGDRLSLSEWLQKGQFVAEDIKRLMSQLIRLFEHAREYFLDERDIILMSDCMFYGERTRNLSVAYLDGYGGDVGKGISKVLETCIDNMDHHDRELVFLVYGLHKISKEENFCLNHLTELIGKKESGDGMPAAEKPAMLPEKKELPIVTRQTGKRGGSCYVKIAAYLTAGILLFVSVFRAGLLRGAADGQTDLLKVAVLIMAIVILEGYLIGREWSAGQVENPVPNDPVVFDKTSPQAMYLNLIPEDWQREEISIRKSPFFIGKNAEKADGIIDEQEVSRVHAKLVIEEGGVFVIDQESSNGTYVNGTQLMPWERRRIRNDDRIGFSTICYRVELDP